MVADDEIAKGMHVGGFGPDLLKSEIDDRPLPENERMEGS